MSFLNTIDAEFATRMERLTKVSRANEEARSKLRKVLNDEKEYRRLIELVSSENNVYDKETETYCLDVLIKAIAKCFDTTKIDNIYFMQVFDVSYGGGVI